MGIYRLLSYHVRQPAHEIGFRMGIGRLARWHVRGSVRVMLRGLSVFFDPTHLPAVSPVSRGAYVLASHLPARRATKVAPVVAWR